jgi:hypothetical protein
VQIENYEKLPTCFKYQNNMKISYKKVMEISGKIHYNFQKFIKPQKSFLVKPKKYESNDIK